MEPLPSSGSGPVTRSRSASAAKALDIPPAGHTQTSIATSLDDVPFPAVLTPPLVETLRLYVELQAKLNPPKDLMGWAVSFLPGAQDPMQTLNAIKRRVAVLLVVGPLYSGRIPHDQRPVFLERMQTYFAAVNQRLRHLSEGRDNLSSLEMPAPCLVQLQNERGYFDAEAFKQALNSISARLQHVRPHLALALLMHRLGAKTEGRV